MMTQTTAVDTQQRFRGELVLALVTLIWGTTFITIQDAMEVWPPMALLTLRFGVAFVCLLPVLYKDRGTLRAWLQGAFLGIFLFAAFGLQTVALVYTTAARTAFGAALVTVLVPLFALVALRVRWKPGTYFATSAAVVGVYLLMGRELGPGVRLGDFMALGAAAAFAVQIMLLGHFTRHPKTPILPMLVAQLGTVAVLSIASSWLMHEPMPDAATDSWQMVLYLAVITTALCLLGQMYGQVRTTSTRAAFIYALEPISAAAFAWILHDQGLTQAEWAGGTLIVLAAVTADQALPNFLRLRRRGEAQSPLQPSAQDVDTQAQRPRAKAI